MKKGVIMKNLVELSEQSCCEINAGYYPPETETDDSKKIVDLLDLGEWIFW
jgi:hypothetical protein